MIKIARNASQGIKRQELAPARNVPIPVDSHRVVAYLPERVLQGPILDNAAIILFKRVSEDSDFHCMSYFQRALIVRALLQASICPETVAEASEMRKVAASAISSGR